MPILPPGAQEVQYQNLLRALPNNWFHLLSDRKGAMHPFLWGIAGVLASVQIAYGLALNAAIPMLSFGAWLSLHLQSIGLTRGENESDEAAKKRYQWEFEQTRNTRSGLLRTFEHYTGLKPPQIRLEGDRAKGKIGQFRMVIHAVTQPWSEINLTFIGEVIRRYVANGIIPGLDVRLQCLIVAPLPPWQFHDPFPNTWTTMGPIWERPAFATELRLDIAQNVFAQVSDTEWRSEKTRLRLLQSSVQASNAPGALFLYLTDPGNCPYLAIVKTIPVATANPTATPIRSWFPDGYQFSDGFPKPSAGATSFVIPPLEINAPQLVPSFTPINLLPIISVNADPIAPLSTIEYRGIDFTRLQIARYEDVIPVAANPVWDAAEYAKMRQGNWQLRIGSGDPGWGNFPLTGTTWTSIDGITIEPAAIWWTDVAGNARSHVPLHDPETNSVYLAIEFFLTGGREWTLREMELNLQGTRQHYRRVAVPIDSDIHTGFIFKVRGQFTAA